jgi:phospho-N-acetylmuramoyl-pentapeptide-transferase
MLSYLSEFESFWGPLRIFRYITFRSIGAIITALILGFLIAPVMLSHLKRLKMAQFFRSKDQVGTLAILHAGKKDTPTMGGLIIYLSVIITTFFWAKWNLYVVSSMIVYTFLTCIGFYDDYIKVTKKNTKGFSGSKKLIAQALLTFFILLLLNTKMEAHRLMLELWIPFYKLPLWSVMPGWFLFLFCFFVLAGSSNAINVTDGLDGLAIGCTIMVALTYAILAYVSGNKIIADYFFISYVPHSEELVIICMAIVGAGLTFLWYNCSPAQVFMGDTGSLALGGLIGIIAFLIHQPFTLVIVGGIFVIEVISDILQVGSYKLRQKRIFAMAPIHHHFELKGWPETKVVIRFWIISFIFALIGLSTLKLR